MIQWCLKIVKQMAKVTFLPDNKECDSPSNVTLLEVAKRNNIPHVAACGGEEELHNM